MSSTQLDTQPEGPVGLFWDYDSVPSLEERDLIRLIHKLDEFGDVLSGGQGLQARVLCHHSPKNTEYFRKYNFEVIDQDGDSWNILDSGVLSVTSKILLWLWDQERKTSADFSLPATGTDNDSAPLSPPRVGAPVILMVTANDHFAHLFGSLRQRGVDIVCLSTFSSNPNSALRHACTSALDFKQFLQNTGADSDIASARADQPAPPPGLSSSVSEEKTKAETSAAATKSDSVEENLSMSKENQEECSPHSPSSARWSPTLRELDVDDKVPAERVVVPALVMPTSEQEQLDGQQQQQQGQQQGQQQQQQQGPTPPRHSVPLNPATRLLAGEDIAMDSPRSLDSYINKEDDVDGNSSLLMEQRTLHDELVSAIYMNNVKSAVATLRKMYTRQSRSFRIPALLSLIMPDTAAMLEDSQVELFHVSVKFALDCIQWCFGIQRGENVESFKYKMNKNIARWILRETQRKGLPNPASQYTVGIALALMKIILVDTTEVEFAFEILTCLNVPRPLQYFIPYLTTWMQSPPAVQQRIDMKALQKFVYEHPDLYAYMQQQPSSSREAVSVRDAGNGGRSSMPPPSGGNAYMSRPTPRTWEEGGGAAQSQLAEGREEWIRDSSSAQQDAREHMLYHLNEFGESSGKMGRDGERQSQQGGASGQNPNTQPLEAKLLKLLMRSSKGELGARIPALYRDEYGEPLRLRGRKLKDLLLETGLVEMVGSDGPGDKLFRIIGDSNGDMSPQSQGRGGGGPSKPKDVPRGRDATAGDPVGGYRGSTLQRDGGEPYGASMMQHSDHHGGRRVPQVPSLLNDEYSGGLNAILKKDYSRSSSSSSSNSNSSSSSSSGSSYGSHGFSEAGGSGRHRLASGESYDHRQQQHHQYPHHLQHHQQQHHHQQQYQQPQHQQQHNGMSSNLMHGSYPGGKRRDDFMGAPPRDGSSYLHGLYDDRSLPQSSSAPSSTFMFDSRSTYGPGAGGSASTLSELNMDSLVLGDNNKEVPR